MPDETVLALSTSRPREKPSDLIRINAPSGPEVRSTLCGHASPSTDSTDSYALSCGGNVLRFQAKMRRLHTMSCVAKQMKLVSTVG